ncbi:MAG: YraN family protein [Bacillota bacterium]
MLGFRKELGVRGEDIAVRHLESLGFEILERNFRCKAGEIDVVARKGNLVAFVEVKTRRPGPFGTAREQITDAKRRRIVGAARTYVAARGMAPACYRFDVVAIDIPPGAAPSVELIAGAFDGWG